MTSPGDDGGGLRERLLRELDRGEDAQIGELLDEIGVHAEPPADVDERIAAVAREVATEAVRRSELAEPPPDVGARIGGAARDVAGSGARGRRRRWPMTLVVAGVAMAAALAVGFGLGRGLYRPAGTGVARDRTSPPPGSDAVHVRLANAMLHLACDAERTGEGDPMRIMDVHEGDGESRGWKEWSSSRPAHDPESELVHKTGSERPETLGDDDQDRFAAELVTLCERVRVEFPRLAPDILETLVRSLEQCAERSRCRGRIALAVTRVALALNRRDEAARHAAIAKAYGDAETRAQAQKLIDDSSLPDGR